MKENSSNKCFSGILRRLLCAGSLQTHPSDQFIEANKKERDNGAAEKCSDNVKQVAQVSSTTTTGVVAKLMGLDSLPNTPGVTPRDRSLGSYFRSRSVNSIDFLSHFDPTTIIGNNHHHHRRVRTSVSFRENDDYGLALQLEKVDENDHQEELMFKRRPKVNYYQQKVKKSETLMEKKVANKRPRRIKKLETSQSTSTRVDFNERRPITRQGNAKGALVESKCMQKPKPKPKMRKKNNLAHQKVHSQCSLKKIHPEKNLPEIARPVVSSIRPDDGEFTAIIKRKPRSQNVRTKGKCHYKSMVEEICSLTEEEVNEKFMSKFEDFEEICQEFGHEILEVLLKQLVDELVLIYGTW